LPLFKNEMPIKYSQLFEKASDAEFSGGRDLPMCFTADAPRPSVATPDYIFSL